jgi:hypothetical protein
MAIQFTDGKFHGFNDDGTPLVGGLLYTYVSGTTTPQATYTDSTLSTPNTNPVVLNSRGEASVWLGSNAYTMKLLRADGSLVWSQDGCQDPGTSVTTLRSDLASTTDATKGAALVGSYDAANYFNGANVEAILQEIGNPKGQFQLDGVNVFRYIPPSEWAAIIAGTSTTDLKTYLQTALTAESNLIFPDGLYNTSVALIPKVGAKLRGINRRGCMLNGTASNAILQLPYGSFDPVIENIRFMGAGCTGISVATTAGTLQGYLIRPHIRHCDFDYDLAYGINADLIFGDIERSTFGYYGVAAVPAPGASNFVAIKSYVYPATTNYTNVNTVRNCIFQHAGSLTQAAIDLSGGTAWTFDSCDFEQGGVVISASNVQLLKFTGSCWMEANSATNALISIGACTTPAIFEGVNFANNTCDHLFQAPLDGTCKGLVIRNCEITKAGSSYVLYDTVSLARTLPANGSVTFYDNHVTGGSASDKFVTGTDFRGGPNSIRLTAIADTTGLGTLIYCSDPGVSLVRNGTGDVTLTNVSHPLASATNKVMAVVTGQTATESRALVTNTSSVRIQGFNSTGTATDGILTVHVTGA